MNKIKRFLCGAAAWTSLAAMWLTVANADAAADITIGYIIAGCVETVVFACSSITYMVKWG